VDLEALAGRVKAGDTHGVSRLITLIENQDANGVAVLKRLQPSASKAAVIGITGYPGAGKSSLIAQLVTAYRHQKKKVAILAVDTSSPITGGAILGDRIRMQEHVLDPGVFIRSMASRGRYGGVAHGTGDAVEVLKAAGFDIIFVETIGVGQADVEVASIAHTVVLVVAPGLGDEIQAMKAGILEVAHIVVVNKADREGADATVRDLTESGLRVVRTMALKGEGLPELIQAIAEHQRLLDLPATTKTWDGRYSVGSS
jgi:LAO/AO transport system kinase